MSVYLAIPSKKPVAACERVLGQWRDRGYKLAIWRDSGDETVSCDILLTGKYPGYAAAVNALCGEILKHDANAEFMVIAGDDILPDPSHDPQVIASECIEHFGGTFGVMQPTGHRWGEDPSLPNLHPMRTAYIDRVAGSAWYGREYCERMYGGTGPLFGGYYHMFVDEEAQQVALRIGVFWQRLDLAQEHRHWVLEKRPMPGYLETANSPAHWNESKTLFDGRKAAGFPGHEPVSVLVTTPA